MTTLMKARLVYSGMPVPPRIPDEMGTPKDTQFQGTPREQTAELCGRVCYDSLGKGRDSLAYHQHIHEVGHYSVYEHTPITVSLRVASKEYVSAVLAILVNRPGVWTHVSVEDVIGVHTIRITINFRALIEWDTWPVQPYLVGSPVRPAALGESLRVAGHQAAPMIVPRYETQSIGGVLFEDARIVEPVHPEEQWVTLFLSGSRGFSHEQVRHGDSTAISQRSTRYVDESESRWVVHPLIEQYCVDQGVSLDAFEFIDTMDGPDNPPQTHPPTNAKRLYDQTVACLQAWMLDKGIDKFNARKQARGAARGYLGNALLTEMLFSANVRQWHLMIGQRASQFADAEIRQVYADPTDGVIAALKQSQYGDQFQCYELEPAPDGIGHVAVRSDTKANADG